MTRGNIVVGLLLSPIYLFDILKAKSCLLRLYADGIVVTISSFRINAILKKISRVRILLKTLNSCKLNTLTLPKLRP